MTHTLTRKMLAPMIIASALGAGGSLVPVAADASENCKRVYIEAINKTGKTIKVIDIDYYDYGAKRWRTEMVKNRILRSGESWSWRKNLEGVNAEETRVRIEYRTKKRGRKVFVWSKVKRTRSAKKTCARGSSFAITLS